MDSSPTNPAPMREEDQVNLFKEVQGIFDKFLKCLLSIIAFKVTDTEEHFFKTRPNIMTAIVLAVVVYFSAWLLTTTLQLHLKDFFPLLTCIVLAIGGIAFVLALITIFSPLP